MITIHICKLLNALIKDPKHVIKRAFVSRSAWQVKSLASWIIRERAERWTHWHTLEFRSIFNIVISLVTHRDSEPISQITNNKGINEEAGVIERLNSARHAGRF